MYLRLAHLKGICDAALWNHQEDLGTPYKEYIDKNMLIGNETYNYEQDEFISKLYPATMPMPRPLNEQLDKDYFLKYDKINELFEFIFQVKYLEKSQREYYWKYHSGRSLGGILSCFWLADSRLIGICQDTIGKTCMMSFTNVVTYDSGILGRSNDVDVTDIAICFKNVSSVRMQGFFRYEPLEIHHISNVWLSKESDTEYCYSVLSPIGKEGFIVEVIFTDYVIDIKPYSYYANNSLPISL